MLPENPHGMRPQRVCLVGNTLGSLSSLLESRAIVHVLKCSAERSCVPAGVCLTMLETVECPAAFHVPNLYEPSQADVSDRVRHALEHLQRKFRFDRIEFACSGGVGFRAIQAKRAGLAFTDVDLAVRFDSCGVWEREAAQRWAASYDEIDRDFREQFAAEHADLWIAPRTTTQHLMQRGWKFSDAKPRTHTTRTPLVTIAIAHFNLGEFLPATLASLAAQTYQNLEVIVIDDGSTDARSQKCFESLRQRYPQFCFVKQVNAGIGATRNHCLERARGEFFIPVDADNIAHPEMVERFVAALQRNPDYDAMTCYFLAFESTPEHPIYAHRPTGGPLTLAAIRNVYGDANAIFRTTSLRHLGGYETDRGTSCEDWELFVKMVRAGQRIGVVPEHLFDYRQRPGGFSRSTNWFANHQRVLRQFGRPGSLEPADSLMLSSALLGFHQRILQLESERRCRRYRIADCIHSIIRTITHLFHPRTPISRDATFNPIPVSPHSVITYTAEATAP